MNDRYIKRARTDGKIVDLVPEISVALNNPDIYQNNTTAIHLQEFVLPLRGVSDVRPGVYPINSAISRVVIPKEEEKQNYSAANIIDFSNVSNIKDTIAKQALLSGEERYILETTDHTTSLRISEKDTPIMAGFKESINAKKCDVDCYEQRMGSNFNNNIRLLSKEDITIKKVIEIGDALDVKVTISFEDKSKDVPNPMGKKIDVVLTGGENE